MGWRSPTQWPAGSPYARSSSLGSSRGWGTPSPPLPLTLLSQPLRKRDIPNGVPEPARWGSTD